MKTSLVEEAPHTECGAVFLQGHMPPVRFTKKTFVTKRLPREACFDKDDVKVERHCDLE